MKKYYGACNFANNSHLPDLESKIKNEFEYTFQCYISASIDNLTSSMLDYQRQCITILRLMREVGIISEDEHSTAFECVNQFYDWYDFA